jgi:hypothetical protein
MPVSSDVMNVTINDSFAIPSFFATDVMSAAVLKQAFGPDAPVRVPADFTSAQVLLTYLGPRTWFAWMNGSTLEFSRLNVSADVSTGAVTVYLRGRTSTATGIMGVDTSWTVTPN